MATNTPNYSFILPAVNNPIDANLWGGYLNTNFSSIDTLLYDGNFSPTLIASTSVTTPLLTGVSLIKDVNGNNIISLPATVSAVNNILVANSAAGDAVGIQAVGSDTDIDIEITPKGTGNVNLVGSGTIQKNGIPITAPTRQTFITGSGTYNTPAGCKFLSIRMIGAGGGGGGSGNGGVPTAGSNGGNTSFNSIVAAGGGGGGIANPTSAIGGVGGTGGSGTADLRIAGADGSNGNQNANFVMAGDGGQSVFGGRGKGNSLISLAGQAAKTNTGSGGGGSTTNLLATTVGAGGGAGEYVELFIINPGASYSYAVGAGGAGGAAGTSGYAGGAGANGIIIVDEYY